MDEWLLDITQLLLDPSPWLQWVIGFFGSWRLAYMAVYETGPRGVFTKVRERVGIEHDDDGQAVSWGLGFLPSIFRCVMCMTLWTTPLTYAILWAVPPLGVIIGTWAAATYLEALRTR